MKWKCITKKVSDLIPLEYNPHVITKRETQKLKDSINKVGFISNIVIDTNNIILSGNARYEVLKEIYGLDYMIDCYIPEEELMEDERKKIILLLNTASSSKKINQNIINDLYLNIDDFDYDLQEIKIEDIDLSKTNDIIDIDNKIYELRIQCKDETEQQEIYNKLLAEGYDVHISIL